LQVIHHFPHVLGICQGAVHQLQDLDSNTTALQAQVDALVSVNERQQLQMNALASVNERQQLQIDSLTEFLKQHMLLPQDNAGFDA
jgi:hypothetical protein